MLCAICFPMVLFIVCCFVPLWDDRRLSILDPKTTVSKPKAVTPEQNPSAYTCHVRFKDPAMALCNIVPYHNIGGNFGDLLGPAAVLKLLENHFQCDTSTLPSRDISSIGYPTGGRCLFHLGSVMHFVRSQDHVWGTGISPHQMKQHKDMNFSNVTFYSVRGPLSLHYLQGKYKNLDIASFGDPGFLIPFLYPQFMPSNSQNHTRFCFLPHAEDRQRVIPRQMKVVKVHQRWTKVLDMIANNCTHVASSSLHGMIVADAMGLPYVWFQAKRSPVEATQGQFKYRDYLQSVGRMSEKPLNLTRFLTSPAYYYTSISLQDRNKIIERTLESFPFHLFESQPGMAKGRALRAVPLDPKTIVSKQGTLQQAAKSQNRCKIRFKDPTMAICNFVPYKIIKGNFGDLLGPATVLRLLEQHFQCDSSEIKNHDIASDGYPKNDGKCLFHLGSVMHFVRPGDSVWGTGINPLRLPRYRGITLNLTKVTFYSVRGPDTLKFIQQDASRSDVASLPFGDPGFLIPFLYPKFMPKTTQESVGNKRFCFIPHAQDRHRVLPPGIQVIPVSQQWTKVVEVVSSSCTHVAASSLHGMIIADAMGLPSLWFQWINSKTDRTEGAFKYVDYLKSVGRKVKTPIWRENQLSDPSSYYQPFSLKERKEIADRTIASFPFDLFESFT